MKRVPLGEVPELADSGVWGPEDVAEGVSVLRSTNFRNDGTLNFSSIALRSIDPRKRVSKLLLPGDILLEKSGGGPMQPVGRVCRFEGSGQPHAFGNFLARLRPRGNMRSEYLCYFRRYFHRTGQTNSYQKQTTGIRNLEFSRYLTIEVPCPAEVVQSKEADKLARAEGILRLRREAQSKAAELIPALFLDRFGDPVGNPKGWPVHDLGTLIRSGPQNGLYKHKSAYGSGTPILRIDGFYDGTIRDATKLRRLRLDTAEIDTYELKTEDIVINRVNSPEYLGKSALIPQLSEPTVFESNMMRFAVDKERLLPGYLIALLQTQAIRAQILSSAKHAINQSSINQQDVKALRVPLPPVADQRAFVGLAASATSILRMQEMALAKAQATFDALLHRCFSSEPTHVRS